MDNWFEKATPNQDDSSQGMWFEKANDPWEHFKAKAIEIATQRNFPVNVLLGQSALESARGTAAPGNNYFGIKGNGTAGSNNLATQEFGNGGYFGENSNFAAHNTPEDSINQYLDLIQNTPRYQWAYQQYLNDHDTTALLNNIWKSGYATSPTYASDVSNTPEFKGGSN
jgi:flagellum-specific peptidoglycan hydrolase FlgJ